MAAISLRLDNDDYLLLKTYAEANGQTVSSFVKDAIFDKLEDEVEITEEELNALWEREKDLPRKSAEQVFAEMGL